MYISRYFNLLRFEFKKLMSTKKAYFFIFALNALPVFMFLMILLTFFYKDSIINDVNFPAEFNKIIGEYTLIAYSVFFAALAPFFISLFTGDMFSEEFSNGYMRMLLLTPVSRSMLLFTKWLTVMLFAVLSLCTGLILIQLNIFIAQVLLSDVLLPANNTFFSLPWNSLLLFNFGDLCRYLFVFVVLIACNVSFIVLISLFFTSTMPMSVSCVISMGSLLIASPMAKLFLKKESFIRILLTNNFITKSYDLLVNLIKAIVKHISVFDPLMATKDSPLTKDLLITLSIWTIAFLAVSLLIFNRKKILR